MFILIYIIYNIDGHVPIFMCIHIYLYTHTYVCVYIYICTYAESVTLQARVYRRHRRPRRARRSPGCSSCRKLRVRWLECAPRASSPSTTGPIDLSAAPFRGRLGANLSVFATYPITPCRVFINAVGYSLRPLATDHLLHNWGFLGTRGLSLIISLWGVGWPHNIARFITTVGHLLRPIATDRVCHTTCLTMPSSLEAQSSLAGFVVLFNTSC